MSQAPRAADARSALDDCIEFSERKAYFVGPDPHIAARAELAALREKAGALDRLEAWLRSAPRVDGEGRAVENVCSTPVGEISIDIMDERGAYRGEIYNSLSAAITAALASAARAEQTKEK